MNPDTVLYDPAAPRPTFYISLWRRSDHRALPPRWNAVGVRVSVYRLDATTDTRLGLLTTASVGEGGWVELAEALVLRSGQGFVVMPEEPNT